MPHNEVFALLFGAFLICAALYFCSPNDVLGLWLREHIQKLEDSLDDWERRQVQ